MWSFGQAPPEFRTLFPEGRDPDWVVHVPEQERQALEPLLLRWQRVYPVKLSELADRSVAFFGAPREAIDWIGGQGTSAAPFSGVERRRAARLRIDCQSRYETRAVPSQYGRGHTIDMSWSGVCFTTESQLTGGAEIVLHVAWPVHLEGDVPVELLAVGKVTRAETTKAAMQLDSMSFSLGNPKS